MLIKRETKVENLTPDIAWTECLKMWKWISDEIIAGYNDKTDLGHTYIVHDLKRKWLRENGYKNISLDNHCFFCELAGGWNGGKGCSKCELYIHGNGFICNDESYELYGKFNYQSFPISFYKKIVEINNNRLVKIP